MMKIKIIKSKLNGVPLLLYRNKPILLYNDFTLIKDADLLTFDSSLMIPTSMVNNGVLVARPHQWSPPNSAHFLNQHPLLCRTLCRTVYKL